MDSDKAKAISFHKVANGAEYDVEVVYIDKFSLIAHS